MACFLGRISEPPNHGLHPHQRGSRDHHVLRHDSPRGDCLIVFIGAFYALLACPHTRKRISPSPNDRQIKTSVFSVVPPRNHHQQTFATSRLCVRLFARESRKTKRDSSGSRKGAKTQRKGKERNHTHPTNRQRSSAALEFRCRFFFATLLVFLVLVGGENLTEQGGAIVERIIAGGAGGVLEDGVLDPPGKR